MESLKIKEEDVNKFDFTRWELEFIIDNANFTEEQLKIFNLLTGKNGRKTIIAISIEMNMSTSTVKRRIKQIRNRIIRLL